MLQQLKNLIKDEEAPTAVEYALMVACVAVAIIAGAYTLGVNANEKLGDSATDIKTPSATH